MLTTEKLVKLLKLELFTGEKDYINLLMDISRPGLEMAGYFHTMRRPNSITRYYRIIVL